MEETSAEVEEELFTRPLLSVASWLNPPRLNIWPLAYGSSPNICSSDNLTSSEAHPLLLPSLTREFLSLALFWRCGSKKSLFLSLKWPSDRNLRMLSISSFVGTLDSSARANCKNPIVSQIRPLSCREHILPLFPAPNLRSVATRPETFSRFHQHTFQVSLLLDKACRGIIFLLESHCLFVRLFVTFLPHIKRLSSWFRGKVTLENWKNWFCSTFYTFAMGIFWMGGRQTLNQSGFLPLTHSSLLRDAFSET